MAETLNINIAVLDKATGPLNKVSSGVSQFGKRVEQTNKIQNQFGVVADKNTRGLSRFAKSGLQQTGYQVGDFAVQVSGGTSAIQAFGQQGSQLLGIFGPVGAVLGAVVAIAAAFGNAFAKADAEATGFTNTTEALNEAMRASAAIGSKLAEGTDDLSEKYGKVTPEVIRLVNAQRALNFMAQVKAFHAAKGALVAYTDKVKEAGRIAAENAMFRTVPENLKHLMESFEDLTEGLGTKSISAINKLGERLRAVAGAEGFEQTISAVTEAREQLARMGAVGTERGDELAGVLTAIAENALAVQNGFKNTTDVIAEGIKDVTGLAKTFGLAQKAGDNLAQGIASSMGQSFSSVVKGTQSVNKAFQNMAASIIDQLFNVLIVQQLVGTVGTATTAGTGIAGFLTRATGGPVSKGQTYLVGERGPELFTPSSSGQIIPNNKMGGGVSVVNNLTVNSNNPAAVRSEVISMLPMIKEASKSAVLEASRRGGSYANSFGN